MFQQFKERVIKFRDVLAEVEQLDKLLSVDRKYGIGYYFATDEVVFHGDSILSNEIKGAVACYRERLKALVEAELGGTNE